MADETAFFAPGETFVDKVWARVQDWQREEQRRMDAETIRQATTHEYCYLLHAAPQHAERIQNRAQEELIAYGWHVARTRCGRRDWAEEVILKSVDNVWRRRDRLRDPGSFLALFTRDLGWEIGRMLKKDRRIAGHEITESDLPRLNDDEDEKNGASFLEMLVNQGEMFRPVRAQVERCVSQTLLIESLHRCLKDWKKSFTIIAEFCIELNPNEIAWLLSAALPGKSIKTSHVFTYKSRALEKLRKEVCRDAIHELISCVQH
ncbi:MAG: hypothetical protein KF893_09935 [Caldilineaceae bacterium]|nr:hypothetical protein [Caldilineaceae bacterium]